ncbi:FecR family protein [Dyadobacter sp. CY312]|uniref:FecR family protein n=1 Tax=Dyadobacter sp. CY312 TaxID=2907303 RepID=UPI001F1CE0A5|nr:FecR family protein [Dyadobacter sp. CY312]MCE7041386.1 FecR family protein [Dyadobacter sp. CY312]
MKQDRSTYQLDDFLADDSFKDWVLGAGDPAFWQDYLLQNPHQKDLASDAGKLILSLKATQQSDQDQHTAEHIWENIKDGTVRKKRIIIFRPVYLRVAAALLVVCLIGYRFTQKQRNLAQWAGQITGISTSTLHTNTSGQPERIRLSDGSVVILQDSSSLEYDKDFDVKTRTVYLEGKAFFDVAKNAEKPFIIYSNELVTKVLGTSFAITANKKDKDVTVSVVTGKVAVVSQDQFEASAEKQSPILSGLLLTPNQKAVYSRSDARLAKTLVDRPVVVDKGFKASDFSFENTPVGEVFDLLSKAYGINIVYDKSGFENCSLIVSLENEGLYDKLSVICKTLGTAYKVVGSEIHIEGKVCK